MPGIETIEALAKRRGFFWLSSEIYGGFSGFYDYGPMGTALKRKLENEWRSFFLGLDPNFFEIDTRNIMPEKVFRASGHLESFVDPIAKCRKCGTFHRADHIMEEYLKESFEGMTPGFPLCALGVLYSMSPEFPAKGRHNPVGKGILLL